MANSFDPVLAQLAESVTQNTSVTQSAVAAFQGLRQAVQEAQVQIAAAGLTPEQQQVFADLDAAMDTNSQALADAIAANT